MERDSALLLGQISSHMLNSLNTAIAVSDRLAARLDARGEDNELTDQIAALRHNQFQVLRTAQNMLELSRLTLEEPLSLSAVDLNDFCAALIDTVRTLTDGAELCFLPSPRPCLAVCDEARLRTMLLNLLSNSLLHCVPGDRVELQLSRTDTQLSITIRDTGAGISQERVDTVFRDYLRQPLVPDAEQGAGLGLSVAEAIAKAHGGTLVLTSRPDDGTSAVVSIPFRGTDSLHSHHREYGSGMRDILAGLSDVLDYRKFRPNYL